MRRALIGITALSFVMVPLSSTAQNKTAKPADPNKKVCRREIPTGSVVPRATCHTVAQWAQIDANNSSAADQALSGSMTGKVNPH